MVDAAIIGIVSSAESLYDGIEKVKQLSQVITDAAQSAKSSG